MATELTESNQRPGLDSFRGEFDATGLVSKKPSSVPRIFEYIVGHAPTSPKEIRQAVNVSKSVTFSSLEKLLRQGLVTRPSRGEYEPSDITLDPDCVQLLGELRSRRQLELCEFADRADTFETSDLTSEFGGYRSAVRATAVQLSEKGFLKQEQEPFEKSPRTYRVTEPAKRALATLDVDDYRGRDGRHVSAYPNGIGGTDFRTAYEIEDAHYIAEADRRWIEPPELAETLGKDRTKTLSRLADMVDRGLLASKPLRHKQVFEATPKTTRLVRDLRLFRISKAQQLDFYSLATRAGPKDAYTPDELYTSLVKTGHRLTTQTLNTAIEELKRADLIKGNSRTGYRFVQP